MKIFKFTSVALMLILASCQTDEPAEINTNVDFNFTNPVENFMYGHGDTVLIEGTISANVEMHGYEIELINASDNNDQLLFRHAHEDGVEFNVSDQWINTLNAHGNLELTIRVTLNHTTGEMVEKTYNFMAHHM